MQLRDQLVEMPRVFFRYIATVISISYVTSRDRHVCKSAQSMQYIEAGIGTIWLLVSCAYWHYVSEVRKETVQTFRDAQIRVVLHRL